MGTFNDLGRQIMIVGLICFICFQLAGEWLVVYLSLPLPGSICGMLLLLVFMIARGGVDKVLLDASGALFSRLPLLLIPVTVGVMPWLPFLSAHFFELSFILLLSYLLTYLFAFFLMNRLVK